MGKQRTVPDDGLQRELWALALLLLSILLTLSFIPPTLIGESGARLFPTGNIVGSLGALISRGAWDLLGVCAFLVPALPAVWAAGIRGQIDGSAARRFTILLVGLLVLIPMATYAFARPVTPGPSLAGWLGRVLGEPLTVGLGWVGAALLTSFAIVALSVITIGWNPLRVMAQGGRSAWSGSRSAVGAVGGALTTWWSKRRRPGSGDDGAATLPPEVARGAVVQLPDPLGLTTAATADPEATIEEPVRRATAAPKRAQPPEPEPFPDAGDPTSADLPASDLLKAPPSRDEAQNRQELEALGTALIEKLATFRIEGEIVGTTSGPVVTQFEVSPAPGVKVARIANLEADLALAMRAPSVRIVAPIPGKGAVGVEVPNPRAEMVFFREVLDSGAFRRSRATLPLALGKDISGKPYVADLARMPHLLIAGATGSGKSVCINTIITSLVYRHSPKTLRLLMVDPKMVELSVYNDLPHLRHPVVTDNNEAATVLKWAVMEMEQRYALLSANKSRNLQDFNGRVEQGQRLRAAVADGEEGDPERWVYKGGPLPYVVLIIDELADLMMTVQGEVEKPLALLAQKARAIGIHLILATQRPSVNVITGLIKANFPSRIAFRVSSKVDSRTILDQNGADSLLGNGDMLFLPPGTSDPMRLQGAFLSTEETEQLMDWYRERARERDEEAAAAGADHLGDEPDILEVVRAAEGSNDDAGGAADTLEDRDKLFRDAAELCIQHQGGSTSLLQRRLRIGYGRAARIIDQLHHAGVLGPADGSKPREVLIDLIQFDQMYGE